LMLPSAREKRFASPNEAKNNPGQSFLIF
jgi:hypothetical protein